MNLLLLPDPQFPPLSNKDYKHPPGQGNSELPYVGQPARRRSSINVSPITRPLRRPRLRSMEAKVVELKASSRQLVGGAHGTFMWTGREHLPASRTPQTSCTSIPLSWAPRGGLKPVARDPGAARAQEVAAGRPLLAGKELPDRATGPRLAAMFRVPSLECARAYWVPGRPALSRPARRGYEGIKIK